MLEILDVRKRLEHILVAIEGEMDVLQIEKRIRGRVKAQMEKSQREYYLNEQMKAIQKELGEMDEGGNEITRARAEDRQGRHAQGGAREGHRRAQQAEDDVADVGRGDRGAQLHRLAGQGAVEEAHQDPARTSPAREKVLDEDHYGLEKVKERIVEYLAVQQRVEKLKGPILCLVGPPGVGKTSLGQSIARATNRKFVRMSLGGVRDEAEIRGHRRTYIGSMPGKIVQNMAKAGVHNPLFLLDEVDKMSMDFRGDPSSALLEVLDPEQNATFNDHYLEVDFDLSEVMFVCTANTLNIPAAAARPHGGDPPARLHRGREDEHRAALPGAEADEEQRAEGPTSSRSPTRRCSTSCATTRARPACATSSARSPRSAARRSSRCCWTRRNETLGRGHAAQPRQVPRRAALPLRQGRGHEPRRPGDRPRLDRGRRRAADDRGGGGARQGQAAAHRPARRGDAGVDPGRDDRGAQPRRRCWASSGEFYQKHDVHLHMPEGATPKDGPSAGIGMCTALVSALTRIPVRSDVAMTGEITLRGEVLPIGGLKEKLLAAHRGGIKTVLIPDENQKDLVEIPDNIKGNLEIKPVKWIDEVLALALTQQPTPHRSGRDFTRPRPHGRGREARPPQRPSPEASCPRALMHSGARAVPWPRGEMCRVSRKSSRRFPPIKEQGQGRSLAPR